MSLLPVGVRVFGGWWDTISIDGKSPRHDPVIHQAAGHVVPVRVGHDGFA